MVPIFDACRPRREVLHGELAEEIFAARLKDVVDGTAEAVYQDPGTFFANTFPTKGLSALLAEAMGRLTGLRPTNNPVIRLETSFGGGKTHNLIGLYHVATGSVGAGQLHGMLDEKLVPPRGAIDVAAVVGTDLSPSDGLLHADGTRTFTLWGELAYQLGGVSGYGHARSGDTNRSAPGTGLFAELIHDRPTLIMIDEIARHMRVAQSVPTATGKSDLAEQTVAFLMALLEFAASRANVVVVFTLAGIEDAFGVETEHLRQQLTEAHRVSGRQEMVLTPTDETEMSSVVTHRLFEHIDPQAAADAATTYTSAFRQWLQQGVGLPEGAARAEYGDDIRHDYPFHPELLNTLNRKTSTIPNFQKTRGALRLLGLVVRRLWETRPANTWLIHPHHIDLARPEIANDLTSRLQRPAYLSVIEADVVSSKQGSPAHAQSVDRQWVEAGKPAYASRAAVTVFLHSLTQGVASGVDPAAVRLAVLEPGDQPELVDQALQRLEDTGWFFDWDGHRYRFKPEVSINKIVLDEMGMVGRTNAKGELDRRLRLVWRSGPLKPLYFPSEPADVPDDTGPPKLVVLHYDAAAVSAGETVVPPDLARNIAERSGVMGAYRTYRNNVLFLVADGDLIDNMVVVAQRYLAIQRITSDAERMREFNEGQRKKLKEMGEKEELDVRVAITRAYRHLFFPDASAPQSHANLTHDLLPAQDQGQIEFDQSSVILRVLRLHKKLLTGDDETLAAQYLKARAWPATATEITTEALRTAFARIMALPILLDLNQLKNTVRNGIDRDTWVYYDTEEAAGYGSKSPPPNVRIADAAVLYTLDEAASRAIPIRGKTPPPDPDQDPVSVICPVCGNAVDSCSCGVVTPPPRLRGEGPATQAFQQLRDAATDADALSLSSLSVTVRGDDAFAARQLRAVGIVLPQLGKGQFAVEASISAEFGPGRYLTIQLDLDEAHYKRLKQVTDDLVKEAGKAHVQLKIAAHFPAGLPLDGPQFGTIHDAWTTSGLDLGPITIEAQQATAEGGK